MKFLNVSLIAALVIVPSVLVPIELYSFVNPATDEVPVPYVVFVSDAGIPNAVISAFVTAVAPIT